MEKFYEAHNVCYSYYKKPLCLKDVAFNLKANEKVILLSPKEMGKTTFLKVLSSFEDRYFGRILFGGKDLKEMSDKEKSFSLVFAEPVFLKGSIRKNIDFLSENIGSEKFSAEELEMLLSEFGVKKPETEKIKKLSLLEKRKLSLLRTFIKKPKIAFVDDVFEGLLDEECCELFEILKKVAQNQAFVFAAGDKSFKKIKQLLCSIDFSKVFYLNIAEFKTYSSIGEFENSKVDYNQLLFCGEHFEVDGFIAKLKDEYFFSFDEETMLKIDKMHYGSLEKLKLENLDQDKVKLVSFKTENLMSVENDELNNKLTSGDIMIFSMLDGTRII